MSVVSDLVSPASFYVHAHRLIWQAACDLVLERKPVDPVTVAAILNDRCDTEEDYGGLDYLQALAMCVPSASNARRYAEIVAEKAAERALIAGMDESAKIAWDSATPLPERIERISGVIQQVERQRKSPSSRRVPLLKLGELQGVAANVSWLVKHVVPAESIGIMFGGSGTFKSFVALDFALHVCHGLPWLGRKTRKGAVIYIAAEGGAGLWPRIDAWHRARGLDWADAPLYVVPSAIDLGADAWRVVDAAQLAGVAPVAVIVDTLSQTFAGEENSANEVASYLRELGARFRALWQCVVLVLHHSGHQATERPRGTSAIRANVDFMLGVFRDADEMLATMTCEKQKDGDRFDDVAFSLSRHVLGHDEDGDELASLVASRVRDGEEMAEIVRDQTAKGRKGYTATLIELSTDGLTERELRSKFYEACDLASADSKSKAYRRASQWAFKAGVIGIVNGRVQVFKSL